MRLQVSLTLPRETITVPMVRRMVASMLESAGVAAQCVDEVKVALTEACTNAYQHAREGDSYEVIIIVDDEFIAMDVIDRGGGISPPAPASQDGDGHRPAESGRGLDLIRSLTESTTFDSVAAGGNVVHMWKRLEWNVANPWGARAGDSPTRPD